MRHFFFLLCLALINFGFADAQIITTIAGTGAPGNSGDSGPAIMASINGPTRLYVDQKGSVYFGNRTLRYRMIDSAGIIHSVIGNDSSGCGADGLLAFNSPLYWGSQSILKYRNSIYIGDGHRVRKVDSAENVNSFAGICISTDIYGLGGPATSTSFGYDGVAAITVDKFGNFFVAVEGEYESCVFKIDTNCITSLYAGIPDSFGYSGDGGMATNATMISPTGLSTDWVGNLYISDYTNGNVRKVTPSGIISTVAGGGLSLSLGDGGPATDAFLWDNEDVAIDNIGNIYIADYSNYRIRKVDTSGIISTVAGCGIYGFSGDGGAATDAKVCPIGIAVDSFGTLFIADLDNGRIRRVINDKQPVFTHGGLQYAGSCPGGPITLDSLLAIVDPDSNQREIWTTVDTPRHGTLSHIPNDTLRSTGDTLYWQGASVVYTPNPGFVGTDTIGLLIADSLGGFQKSIILLQTYYPPVVAGTISGPADVCIWTLATYTDSGSSPGTSTWALSNSNAIFWPPTFLFVVGEHAGLDTLVYTVTNTCGSATTSVVISEDDYPDSSAILAPSVLCIGSSYTYFGGIAGGSWHSANSNAFFADSVFSCVAAGPDTVFRILNNACGSYSSLLPVTINPLPTAGVLLGQDSVCVGASVSLLASASSGHWSASNGATSVDSVGEVAGMHTGMDTIVYVVTNACGSDTARHPIRVLQLAYPGIVGGLDSVCVASQITMLDTTSGGSWGMANSHATIDIVGKVTGVVSGYDTAYYLITNYCGADTARKSIFVKPLPNAGTISGPDSLCLATTATLSDSIVGGNWFATTGIVAVSGGVVTPFATGADTVRYLISNSCGIDTTRHPIVVLSRPHAGAILAGPDTLCLGTSTTLTDTGATTTGTWFATNGNATIVSGSITGVTTGTDTMYYLVTGYCGTDTAQAKQVVAGPPPQPMVTGNTYACVDRGMDTLTATPVGGAWATTNSNASVSATGLVTALTTGQDTLIYTLANTCGDSSATVVITIPDAWTCDSITAVKNTPAEPQLILYPNPTDQTLFVSNCSAYQSLSIVSVPGQRLISVPVQTNEVALKVGNLPAGLYLLQAVSASGQVHVYRFVKL